MSTSKYIKQVAINRIQFGRTAKEMEETQLLNPSNRRTTQVPLADIKTKNERDHCKPDDEKK